MTYICMASEAKGQKSFIFPRHTATRYGIKHSTLKRHLDELEQSGFILRNSGKTTREPNIYEFSQRWRSEDGPMRANHKGG